MYAEGALRELHLDRAEQSKPALPAHDGANLAVEARVAAGDLVPEAEAVARARCVLREEADVEDLRGGTAGIRLLAQSSRSVMQRDASQLDEEPALSAA